MVCPVHFFDRVQNILTGIRFAQGESFLAGEKIYSRTTVAKPDSPRCGAIIYTTEMRSLLIGPPKIEHVFCSHRAGAGVVVPVTRTYRQEGSPLLSANIDTYIQEGEFQLEFFSL